MRREGDFRVRRFAFSKFVTGLVVEKGEIWLLLGGGVKMRFVYLAFLRGGRFLYMRKAKLYCGELPGSGGIRKRSDQSGVRVVRNRAARSHGASFRVTDSELELEIGALG